MNEDVCYFCRTTNQIVLETHHLIPKRFGGRDTDENTVTLCGNCHRCIERLYGNAFFFRLLERLRDEDIDKLRRDIRQLRLPRGLRYNSDKEIVPDYDDDFELVVEAIWLRDNGETLRGIQSQTGIHRSTIHDIYKSRDWYAELSDKLETRTETDADT